MDESRILHIPELSQYPLELWIRGARVSNDREHSSEQERELALAIRVEAGERLLSLTHSFGLVVGLLGHPDARWGIDLEFADREISERAQARLWSKQEQSRLPGLPALAAWTLKEAALKARGRIEPAQTISQWQLCAVTQGRSHPVIELSDGELRAQSVLLRPQDHGIPQAWLALAKLATPVDGF